MSNQLLASCALIVGTTVIIGMGKLKFSWITAVPGSALPVTMTAGYSPGGGQFQPGKVPARKPCGHAHGSYGDRVFPGFQKMGSTHAGTAENSRKDDADHLIQAEKAPARIVWLQAGAVFISCNSQRAGFCPSFCKGRASGHGVESDPFLHSS